MLTQDNLHTIAEILSRKDPATLLSHVENEISQVEQRTSMAIEQFAQTMRTQFTADTQELQELKKALLRELQPTQLEGVEIPITVTQAPNPANGFIGL